MDGNNINFLYYEEARIVKLLISNFPLILSAFGMFFNINDGRISLIEVSLSAANVMLTLPHRRISIGGASLVDINSNTCSYVPLIRI